MASEPVVNQILPLWLPITSTVLSGLSILVLVVLVLRARGTGQLHVTPNLILLGVLGASLALQLGAPLNQLGILPLDPWTFISVAARVVVMVGLVTLATLDIR